MSDRQKFGGPLRRVIRIITGVELAIGGVALLTILVLVFLQAAQRYLPGTGFAWTGEVSTFSLAWLTFIVAGVLVTSRGHIALEVIDTARNVNVVRFVQAFALLVVAAAATGLVLEAFNLVRTQGMIKSPVLRLPMSIVYIPILIGMISTVIRSLVAAVDIAINGPVLPDADDAGERA